MNKQQEVGIAHVNRYVSVAIYVLVILMWVAPDRRLAKRAQIFRLR